MRRKARSISEGLERTVKALADRLEEEHEAVLALARGLAAAVDGDPGNAALWREYRAAVAALIAAGAESDVDEGAQKFLLEIRTPLRTEVGDTEDA